MGGKKGAVGKRGQELIQMGVRVGRAGEAQLTPILATGGQQIQEYLQTGGVGSQLGVAKRAREGAMDASAQGMDATRAALASAGLTGTPYEAAMMGEQKMRGGFAASMAERDAVLNYFTNVLPGLMNAPGQAVGPYLGVPTAALGQRGGGDAGLGGLYAGLGAGAGQLAGSYFNQPAATQVQGVTNATPQPTGYGTGGGSTTPGWSTA